MSANPDPAEEADLQNQAPAGQGSYTVEPGECLPAIAERLGYRWQTLWDHPGNAELRKVRQDPNTLLPGDKLVLPEKAVKYEAGATEKTHRFRARNIPRYLRLVMQTPRGKPLAHQPYLLQIDGQFVPNAPGGGAQTDGDGVIECRLPRGAKEAVLTIDHDTWRLELSGLAPLETVAGLQGRLQNLNYPAGPIDGVLGPRTREALRNFQRDHELLVDGRYGPQTQAKLKAVYGC